MKPRFLVICMLTLGVGACAAFDYSRRYHDGPPTDHFDGTRVFNPGGPIGKGLLDVIQWRLETEPAEWPETVPLTSADKPPQRVEGTAIRASFVGHATVLIQTAGLNILTDPIWSERAFMVDWAGPRRVTPPGIAFEDLPPIDLVVVTHNHYDHLDLPTLLRLQQAHDPIVVVALGNDAVLLGAAPSLKVRTLDWWESVDLGAGRRVHAVPVYHWSRRTAFDRNKALWSGFVIETRGGNVYVAGDTGFWDGAYFREAAERFGAMRLAVLPVGAYEPRWFMKDQHVNPAEAVQVHRLLKARTSLGVHLRTFQLTDEAITQPELELAAALREQGVPPERFLTLPAGGVWSEAQ
jgi:L-ascorbate metabolism protein UlaG (beta-lactamase superfamily)